MFAWLLFQRSRPEWRWSEGVCPGCSRLIEGTFRPAAWEALPGAGSRPATGVLDACWCPDCGVALLAWEASGSGTADGQRLRWHMHSVRTPGGRISERQVTVWSCLEASSIEGVAGR